MFMYASGGDGEQGGEEVPAKQGNAAALALRRKNEYSVAFRAKVGRALRSAPRWGAPRWR